jgi:hypothetical protein
MKNFLTSVIIPTAHCASKHPGEEPFILVLRHCKTGCHLYFQQFVLQ